MFVCYGGSVSETIVRRGEAKQSGGKLVAVNVTLQANGTVRSDGTVQSCKVDGDFFVEASDDSASAGFLHAIEQALIAGTPVQSVIDSYPDCNLVGTDAKAVETAFARALGRDDPADHPGNTIYTDSMADQYHASRWARLLPQLTVIHDQPRLPAEQMHIDEAWAREVADGLRKPTLRIWEWAAPAVVIGRFQSAPDEVNLDIAKQRGFSVVRRCTGGGAMFIEPGNTITYSLYAPLDFVQGVSIEESYRLCDWWLVEALRELGLDVRFSGLNDIASQYGKIGGAAQRRFPVARGDGAQLPSGGTDAEVQSAEVQSAGKVAGSAAGAVLHHVTLAYDIDATAMGEVLNTSREKMSDKAVKSAVKRVDPLRSQTGLSREQIIGHLLDWLVERVGEPGDESGQSGQPGRSGQSLANKS